MTITKIIDFGLVILIWMTQLIVYPGFLHYPADKLLQWHAKYTPVIMVIVGPLMLLQVLLHGFEFLREMNALRAVTLLLILVVWLHTFLVAVPLHNELTQGVDPLAAAEKLVRVNWFRTAVWTVIFLLSLLYKPKNLFL